jgi:hypothetical protein
LLRACWCFVTADQSAARVLKLARLNLAACSLYVVDIRYPCWLPAQDVEDQADNSELPANALAPAPPLTARGRKAAAAAAARKAVASSRAAAAAAAATKAGGTASTRVPRLAPAAQQLAAASSSTAGASGLRGSAMPAALQRSSSRGSAALAVVEAPMEAVSYPR